MTFKLKCACCAIALGLILMFYYGHFMKSPSRVTYDNEMYAAILVVSPTCPFCLQQLDILKEGGSQVRERIKILDTEKDKAEISRIVGNYEAVPLWFNPITHQKTTGLKSLEEI